MYINEHGWELFNKTFKDGDDVILITDEDEYVWGILHITKEFCLLSSMGRRKEIDWDHVRFMAHDGFPVKKLFGSADAAWTWLQHYHPEEATRRALTQNVQKMTEKEVGAFAKEKESWKRYWDRNHMNDHHSPRHVSFGDPWAIEDCLMELVPCPYDREVIILQHDNGAPGLLWDLSTILEIAV